MTEQELREEIELLLWRSIDHYHPTTAKNWTKDVAVRVLALIKKAGYVKPAEDQSLPRNVHSFIERHQEVMSKHHSESDNNRQTYHQAQQDMLKECWRKVILE